MDTRGAVLLEKPPVSIEASMPPAREEVLRKLFPRYDFEHARDTGLFDQFYYNADTSEDSLVHTLAGDVKEGNGGYHSTGYHHEPSGALVWPSILQIDGSARPITRVDRSGIEDLSPSKQRTYEEFPYEPSLAKVVVGGYRKFTLQRGTNDKPDKITEARNNMYPKEYDPFMVAHSIVRARNGRDIEKDEIAVRGDGRRTIKTEGSVPLIDGKTPMRIRMVLDADTKQILTAWPVLANKPGLMKLTKEEGDEHALGKM